VYGVCMMRRTNIYLDDRQHRLLRVLGDARGEPVAALVREAVDAWLQSQGVKELGEEDWRRRFEALLERRRKIWSEIDVSEEELERDVSAAVREVREARAAARRR
jgi:hypothetical protein